MPVSAGLPPVAAGGKAVPFVRAAPPPARGSRNAEKSESSRAFKVGLWVVGVGMALVVAVGGFLAFRVALEKERKPRPAATKPTPSAAKPSPAPTPAPAPVTAGNPVVENPQSLAGKMVGKARDAARAHDTGTDVANDVINDTPAPKPTPDANGTTNLLRTGPAKPANPGDAPPASADFRGFIANMKVSGVFQGHPGRALINGRMVNVGDPVESRLGIRLVDLDSDRKVLIFEDASGARVPRRY